MTTFDDIRPYNDREAAQALRKVAINPLTLKVSRFLFADKNIFYLSRLLLKVEGVRDFQENVMARCVQSILDKTSDSLEISGTENLRSIDGGFVVISNHRDIVMDPSILEYALLKEGLPLAELCVGSNLLSSTYVRSLMRSNRMIKVMRGLSPREIFESSNVLSSYIRNSVCRNGRPVWIAQREGRAKDSIDSTEQAVLKMLNMSGTGSFADNWTELPVVPMSISYEYEPCDVLRARELLLRRRNGTYTKKKGEDLNSILTGIKQKKGHIHIHFCEKIIAEEIDTAAALPGNERFKRLCDAIDSKINSTYEIWKTNVIAARMLGYNALFSTTISPEDIDCFKSYIEHQLDSIATPESDRGELRDILLHVYANPVILKIQTT